MIEGGLPQLGLMKDLLDAISRRPLADGMVRGFLTSEKIPYGHHFRQWNTRGELFVWLSKEEITDQVRTLTAEEAEQERSRQIISGSLIAPPVFGIPIYDMDEVR